MDKYSKRGKLKVALLQTGATTYTAAHLATAHGGPYRSGDPGPQQVAEGVVGDSISTEGGALTFAQDVDGRIERQGLAMGQWASFAWTPDPTDRGQG